MDSRRFLQSAMAGSADGSIMIPGTLSALALVVPRQNILQAKGLEIQDNGSPVRLRGENGVDSLNNRRLRNSCNANKNLEEPFTRGVSAMLADTDVELDTREQWAREVSRDSDVPA